MRKLMQRLDMTALFFLSAVIVTVLTVQAWSKLTASASHQADSPWVWPATLQVYPPHPGDPAAIVKILKGGTDITAGTYRMARISGDAFQDGNAVKDWLEDVSFVVKNQSRQDIVFVGLAAVFPARQTDLDCDSITGSQSPGEPWCNAHPKWCVGGCPSLVNLGLHWGLVPEPAASALRARYRAYHHEWASFQGKAPFAIGAGQQAVLGPAGRGEGVVVITDPRKPFADEVSGILFMEGVGQVGRAAPSAPRMDRESGCAQLPKFNVALDVVRFADGTEWANFGLGYDVPNPDGTAKQSDTRVEAAVPCGKGPAN